MSQPASSSRNLAGYRELITHNHNFRYLWFGQIVSLLGDWFDLIASASLVAAFTGSGMAVGGLFVVRMLAPFLISPIAGVAADRYNRKHLLIISDIARAVIVLGFLLVRSREQVWLLYVLTAFQLGLSGFFFPTRNAILPNIVSGRELGAANALSSATWSVMLAFGAALGGIVAGRFGVYPAFIIDSLTFFASAILIARVSYQHDRAGSAQGITIATAFRQIADGFSYLRHHPDILIISLHKPAASLIVSGGFQVVQVALAEKVYVLGKGGGTSLGLMYAAVGIGTGLGPIFARRFTGDRDRALRIAIALSYVVSTAGLLLIAPLGGFGVVLVGTLIRGVGAGIGWVFSTQLLLQLVPDRVRGRVFSTEFALLTLGNAIGAAVGGLLLDRVALAELLVGMAILILLPGMLWALWIFFRKPVRQSDLVPEGADPPA